MQFNHVAGPLALIGFVVFVVGCILVVAKGVPEKIFKTKRSVNLFFIFVDIFCVWAICKEFGNIKEVIHSLHSNADMIKFDSRIGIGFLLIIPILAHILVTITHFKPEFQIKHLRNINILSFVLIISLFIGNFLFAGAVRSSVERAGYYYCDKASGRVHAFGRKLVYTKDSTTCLEQVEAKTQKSLSAR